MNIYYDSKTGNVERFVNKLKKIRKNWVFQKISENLLINNTGHLISFTTKIGQIPDTTLKFLNFDENAKKIKSVTSSGNMNWGIFYGKCADEINKTYNIPILMKFELSGTQEDVEKYIKYVEEMSDDGE